MRRIDGKSIVNQSTTAQTFYTDPEALDNIYALSTQVKYVDATPAAFNFATTDVNYTTDIITHAAHAMQTGLVGQFTTTTTLPAGLSLLTDYWMIRLSASTFAVADSLAHAQAGTKVALIDAGTGTHTFTATALSGSIQPQISNDITNLGWVSDGSATAFSSSGGNFFSKPSYSARYWRLAFSFTAGQITCTAIVNGETDGVA
jgi:hypothetical protein